MDGRLISLAEKIGEWEMEYLVREALYSFEQLYNTNFSTQVLCLVLAWGTEKAEEKMKEAKEKLERECFDRLREREWERMQEEDSIDE